MICAWNLNVERKLDLLFHVCVECFEIVDYHLISESACQINSYVTKNDYKRKKILVLFFSPTFQTVKKKMTLYTKI